MNFQRRRLAWGAIAAGGALGMAARSDTVEAWLGRLHARLRGGFTVAERVAQYEDAVRERLLPLLAAAGLDRVPHAATLLAFKAERLLELHARVDPSNAWRRIAAYPIRGASGGPGPKLREGDGQVPEGLYRVQALNPNSRFHLSMRLDYPNAFDRRMAQAEGRIALGGDIMIHGTASSIGCLALGNRAAEDLFVLAAWIGLDRMRVLISPVDFRDAALSAPPATPPWTAALYAALHAQLRHFPRA
jgi:hypothetical protein